VGAEPSGDWPQWRGPNRDNISSFKGLTKDWEGSAPKLAWKTSGLGGGYASVSIADGRLYTTGNRDNAQHLVCVDLAKHEIAWSTPLTKAAPKHGFEGARSTPAIDGDRAYVVSSNGAISCISTTDGRVIWSKEFSDVGGKMMSGWGFSESPLIDGDHVVCTPGGEQAMLWCLDKLTGAEVWKSEVADFGTAGKPGAGYSSIVISEGAGVKQYVQLVGRGTIGVRAIDGKLLWTYNRIANGVANIPTCIPSGDYLFTASGYDDGGSALLKLSQDGDGVKADEVYYHNNKELQNHHGGMVLIGKTLYFGHGHNKGFPVAVDLETGKILWNAQKQSRDIGDGSAAITAVDGHLIFRYQSGPVALIEATPSEFRFKGAFKPEIIEREGWSQPVVAGGKLYLREQDHLMVYDIAGTK
jgi:outer membrane protein assembly factor BamB